MTASGPLAPIALQIRHFVVTAIFRHVTSRTFSLSLYRCGSSLNPGGPNVVDTTGAGDCFTAAYAVALLEGKRGADALRFASAAGSICVRRKGAMPSMPSRGGVEGLLAETLVVV